MKRLNTWLDKGMVTFELIGIGALFLIVFITGFWLKKSGKPYPMFGVAIHKILSLVATIFLGLLAFRAREDGALITIEGVYLFLIGFFLLFAFITGGILSTNKPEKKWMAPGHGISAILAIVFIALFFFME
jgi:hypothetical protein